MAANHHILRIGRRLAASCLLALAALSINACNSQGKVENPFDRERVTADVELGEEVVTVEASRHDLSKAGVKHMRAKDWVAAEAELSAAVAAQPKDWRSWFALGAALEMQGKKAEALKAYQSANLHVDGAGDSNITAAIDRLRD